MIEVERALGFVLHVMLKRCLLFIRRKMLEIDQWEGEGELRRDLLDCLFAHQFEGCSQCFVSPHNFVQAAFQGGSIQIAL